MPAPGRHLRSAALLLIGALAVHDLRVVLGYGGEAELILREPAHAYLPFATGAAVVLAVAAVLGFARALTAGSGDHSSPPDRLVTRWLRTAGLLVLVYMGQAGAESFFDPGHPIVGHGGWTVLPLALAIGFVIALASREADAATHGRTHLITALRARMPADVLIPARPAPLLPLLAPLASKAAGRAPPAAR